MVDAAGHDPLERLEVVVHVHGQPMRGHAAGNVASALAIAILAGEFPRPPSPRIGAPRIASRLTATFARANEEILARSQARPAEAGMGTTLTAAWLLNGQACWVQVGDSRLYLHRNDEVDWRPGSILYFRVDDIDAAWDELVRRGVERLEGPQVVFVHGSGVEEWMAFFADGEGNTLALMEQRPP